MRTLLVVLLPALAAAQEYRGYWLDVFHVGYKTEIEIDKAIDDCVASRCNALFVEARFRGSSYFFRSLEPPYQDATWSKFDVLDYLLPRAHAKGIEVHLWGPVTPLWPAALPPPADAEHIWHRHGPNAQGDDMWMTVSNTGRMTDSLDPGHPGAARYLADVIVEPARTYAIDGIHLDYIRYPETDNGYNPKAIQRFNRLRNRTGDPSSRDARWNDFRREQITQLVREIYLRTNEINAQVKISAALICWGDGPASDAQFRLGSAAYNTVFQNWPAWLEEGILDLGIPMNYFAEARNASFLDRWLEFEKNRQFRRFVAPGIASYLNSVPASLAQTQRALDPSVAGNRPAGVVFYSYASTNLLNSAGSPIEPNETFYSAVGELFRQPATPPAMPWKERPAYGHLLGNVFIEGGPEWLNDGVEVSIESASGRPFARRTTTSGTGFFGAVDLEPDSYSVRLDRGGIEFYRTPVRDVVAGSTVRFDANLKYEDVWHTLPHFEVESIEGEIVVLRGSGLATGELTATGEPAVLGRTQVLVNGIPAGLRMVRPDRIELRLPAVNSESRTIVVRHAGSESEPISY